MSTKLHFFFKWKFSTGCYIGEIDKLSWDGFLISINKWRDAFSKNDRKNSGGKLGQKENKNALRHRSLQELLSKLTKIWRGRKKELMRTGSKASRRNIEGFLEGTSLNILAKKRRKNVWEGCRNVRYKWDGLDWISLGGVNYRAAFAANKYEPDNLWFHSLKISNGPVWQSTSPPKSWTTTLTDEKFSELQLLILSAFLQEAYLI